jgi:hypothetical protein
MVLDPRLVSLHPNQHPRLEIIGQSNPMPSGQREFYDDESIEEESAVESIM